jgi:CheY-like chemotaxis protein
MQRGRVLVVDDEADARATLAELLREEGYLVETASDGFRALGKTPEFEPDVVLTDLNMPAMDGLELLHKLGGQADGPVMLVMTGFGGVASAVAAMKEGAADYLIKPLNMTELLLALGREMDRVRLRRERAGHSSAKAGRVVRPISATPSPTRGECPREDADDAHLGGSQSTSPQSASIPRVAARGPLPLRDTPVAPFAPLLRQRAPRLGRTALIGLLVEFGMSSVLVLLDLQRKSGVVIVRSRRGRGRIYVREGRVLRASIEGRAAASGALAVYELLTWSDGRFEFQSGAVEGEDEIGSSTTHLLMEGARRQDERELEKTRFGLHGWPPR